MKRSFCVAGVIVFAASACTNASSATAEAYPQQTVQIVVPYTAGGPTDLAARAVAPCLESEIGGTFVVENKPGGAGAVGTGQLARSEPDGHALGLVSPSTAVVAPLLGDVGYTHEDLLPLGEIYEIPTVLAVKDDSEYATAEELLEAARAKPDTVTVATPGAATLVALGIDLLAEDGVRLQEVPFEGANPAYTAVLGGSVEVLWDAATEKILADIDAGQLRPLAVGSAERLPYLADVPTLAEMGHEALVNTSTMFALAAPRGVAGSVASTLENALRSCLGNASVREKLGKNYIAQTPLDGSAVAGRFDDAYALFEPLVR